MADECLDRCQEICSLNRLKAQNTVGFSYMLGGDEQSAFVVYKRGEIYAYQNHCPHLGMELNWQPDQFLSFDNHSIQCSLHGALFRIEDGFCYSGPCCGESLNRLKVVICEGNVIICPPDDQQ